MQETLSSPFITTNVRWLDAKTFHFTQMSTSGYKSHSRKGGWNRGDYTQKDVPYTLTFDRDIEFLVDKADVDETNETASIENVSKTFEQTQSAPETDAYFFSKVANTAIKLDGYHSETAESAYTKENVFSKLKGFINAGKLRRYKAKGALLMYVRSYIMDLLEESKEFNRKIEMTTINDDGLSIQTRVTDIDGVYIFEVIDDERFYDKFDFTDGFMPVSKVTADTEKGIAAVTGSKKINVLLVTPMTTKIVPKISSIYYFAPGTHTEGDGYLYQNRKYMDVFTFPNGKNGKIDSVYVDLDTTEYVEPTE